MKPYPQAWLMKSGFDRETPVVHIGVVQTGEREMWNDVSSGQQALRENWNREEGGRQLAYLWIEAVDAEGLVVPDATTEVKVSVKGPGRLIALDDGDHYTDLLFNVDTKKMKEGCLLAIVRRTGDGEIVVSAKDEKSGQSSVAAIAP